MSRWYVVDTRIWEVEADDEGQALAQVVDAPDLAPVCRTTTAEPAAGWAPAAPAEGPLELRVL